MGSCCFIHSKGNHSTLGFTEFDVLEKYFKSFNESELGRLHSVFPFEDMAKEFGLSEQCLGRRNIFSPSAQIALMFLKAYTGFFDRRQVELQSVQFIKITAMLAVLFTSESVSYIQLNLSGLAFTPVP